ncbi:MAG: ABC transporter permease [Ruminococcus sp.]|nr:ABC transporter permease [Ruminococcus sp.]MDY3843751.1 ABC transporter permease [Ruminococcus sp.]
MQFITLLNKEIKLLLKNWQLLLVSILVPVLTLIVSYITSETSVVELKIGYIQNADSTIDLLNNGTKDIDGIKLNFLEFDSINEMEQNLSSSDLDAYIVIDNETLKMYYNASNTKGQSSASVINQAVTIINAKNLVENYPDLVDKVNKTQRLFIEQNKVDQKNKSLNPLVSFGFIWIFLYSTLNNSINQIQQEKGTKTLMYIIKSPINKINVFLTKQLAVIFQFLLMNSAYLIFVKTIGLFDFKITLSSVLIWLIVILTVSAIGHLVGMIFNNSGIMLIIELVLVFPVLMADSLSTNLLSKFISFFPTYKATNLMIKSLQGEFGNVNDIVFCIAVILVCYIVDYSILIKKDAVKLCDITS